MQLFDQKGSSVLSIDVSKSFASGGEGAICEHPTKKGEVVKIYHQPRGTKLEDALIELNLLGPQFVKPKDIYYTQKGEIAGFSMDFVDLSKYTVLKKVFNTTYCLQNGFDSDVKMKICQNLKQAVESAHKIGIYIGDLNPYNILVDVKGNVLMLDVDSFGTKSKPHNGVLLEDIRDWLQHPKVDTTTDLFAYDILVFWMFTFMHPFRGDYPICKNLEERVCKKASVLSNLPIILPKCYQPIQNKGLVDQFHQVFQDGKRFLVNLTGTVVQSVATTVQSIQSTSLYIRKIADKVTAVSVSNNLLAHKSNNTWTVVSVKDYGVFSSLYTAQADTVFTGETNSVFLRNGYLHTPNQIKNTEYIPEPDAREVGNSIFVLSRNQDRYMICDTDRVMNNNIQNTQGNILAKSVTFGENIAWQTIGTTKWLIDCHGSTFNLVKTPFNIKNAYARSGYVLIEHVESGNTRYTLCKINGLKLEVGADLPEWRSFDVKGGFVFVPEDGKISLINPVNNWQIVSTIECPVCTFASEIYHTNAGMIVRTGGELYLVNKK